MRFHSKLILAALRFMQVVATTAYKVCIMKVRTTAFSLNVSRHSLKRHRPQGHLTSLPMLPQSILHQRAVSRARGEADSHTFSPTFLCCWLALLLAFAAAAALCLSSGLQSDLAAKQLAANDINETQSSHFKGSVASLATAHHLQTPASSLLPGSNLQTPTASSLLPGSNLQTPTASSLLPGSMYALMKEDTKAAHHPVLEWRGLKPLPPAHDVHHNAHFGMHETDSILSNLKTVVSETSVLKSSSITLPYFHTRIQPLMQPFLDTVSMQSPSSSHTNRTSKHMISGGLLGKEVPFSTPHLLGEKNRVPSSKSLNELVNIGNWRHRPFSQATERLLSQQAFKGSMRHFVHWHEGPYLYSNKKRYLIKGFNAPLDLISLASSIAGRPQVRLLFAAARSASMNTVRVMAFNDGVDKLYPVQPSAGVLNEQVLRDGFDWVLTVAQRHGLRVILVLTDGSNYELGGVWQYIQWINPHRDTVSTFFSNDTYKAMFFDYMTALATRKNTFTGIQYRHDPTLLAWDLINAPRDPGRVVAEDLQGWIAYAASTLRKIDPNHLIIVGTEGFFGDFSPHHLQYNPGPLISKSVSPSRRGKLAPVYNARCEGTDFMRNHAVHETDMACTAVLPYEWLDAETCNAECMLRWTRKWVSAHLRDALRIQKALLVISYSATSYYEITHNFSVGRMVHELLDEAMAKGVPVAGSLVSTFQPVDWSSKFTSSTSTGQLTSKFIKTGEKIIGKTENTRTHIGNLIDGKCELSSGKCSTQLKAEVLKEKLRVMNTEILHDCLSKN
ncbi:hypothetical protein CEUSTIGMA_g13061.t1 [Chlamydomonas eustigma]|uniref:mannan endo-1,4-beta-mannosidase n=1 Tax=Chlamydomonas eustigma TaxID=1157962 RepID=A0A250XRH1_9CHLO|nr:hypothetical protein CEUSTIGMA_g13061.t1 [Chlamydomonas eustigma]|eukprot:GAX85646.1 hypothetical protein CEUSTIGMA_g13061.t1 [Chlamydomonas eustigma]